MSSVFEEANGEAALEDPVFAATTKDSPNNCGPMPTIEPVPNCLLCGGAVSVPDQAELDRLDVFARLMPASDTIIINKVASVAGCSATSLQDRGSHVCPSCHGRLLKLHSLQTSVERERMALADLFCRGRRAPTVRPPSGASLLLVDDVEVRLHCSDVTTVPVTSRRRRQLLQRAHETEHRRFECKVCGKRFRAFSHRVEHMLIHINDRPHPCTACHKTFRTKSALTVHRRVHTAGGSVPCPVCHRQLADAASLRHHARAHAARKPFTCDTCGRQFARRKDHAVHVRQHTGERPYACPQCAKTFVARSRLNRHLLVHREKGFECGCGRSFRRRYDLRTHGRACGLTAVSTSAPAPVVATVAAPQVTFLPTVMLPDHAPTLYYQVGPVSADGVTQDTPAGQSAAGVLGLLTSRPQRGSAQLSLSG